MGEMRNAYRKCDIQAWKSVQLVQGRNQSWVLLRTVMNIWVPQKKRWGFLAWLNDYESVPQEGLSSIELVIQE
jgi:hypothetical protein